MSLPKLLPFLRSALTKLPTILILLTAAAYARPTVTVISPKSGITAGAPVFYEAYATSPGCAAGIAAMRIYTAPGINAFTVNGAHIEHFLNLDPGTYSTVVQAWDNCGGVSKTPVDLTVSSDAGVSVYLPNQSSANWPVHVAASAESPSCSEGIAALRIYTASGVTPYTVNSNTLDAYVNLVPGTYDLTVQAWDNCGHVFKSQLTELVTAGSDAYLYGGASFYPESGIAKLDINSNGTLSNPSGITPLPLTMLQSRIGNVAADPGGWFVYASSASGIYAFQINRSDGVLAPIPGSPFPLTKVLDDEEPPPAITMDPAGHFIYLSYASGTLATYRIHRSSGALSWSGWAHNFPGSFPECPGITGLTTNFTGQYLYISGLVPTGIYGGCATLIYGLLADPNHGFLNSEVSGSPYSPPPGDSGVSEPVSTSRYLYLIQSSAAYDDVLGYSISPSTGALRLLAGSPFAFPGLFLSPPPSFFADWEARFLWSFGSVSSDEAPTLQAFAINATSGEVTLAGATGQFQNQDNFDLAEDHTGQFAFTSLDPYLNQAPPDVPAVVSWAISSNGAFTKLNSVTVSTVYGDAITSLAVARKNPI